MPVKVLGLSTSPRAGGNSDLLLDECLRSAAGCGAEVERIACRDLKLTGCIGCNACFKTGECIIQDDLRGLYDKLIKCDRLIFATPIFFMNASWLGKMAIDRCQSLWARKHILKLPLFDPPRANRQAVLLAVGATKGKRLFDGLQQTMHHFFDTLEFERAGDILVRGVDDKGEVLNHPLAMAQAMGLGGMLGTTYGIPSGQIGL